MKKVVLKIISIIFVIMIITTGLVLLNSRIMKKEKVTIKTMTENEEVSNLQTQVNQLNASHTEYANYVQSCKETIAEAITNQGVSTSSDATAEVMAENIEKILQAKTTATATAEQILNGQTAWVNGSKVTGTMANKGALNWSPTTSTTYTVPAGYYSGGILNSTESYNAGFTAGQENAQLNITVVATGVTSYNNTYTISGKTLTKDNFYFVPTSAYAQPTYNGRYSSGTYTCTINPSLTYTNNTLILSGCTGSKGPDSSHDTGIASLRVTGNIYCIY